jgi:hypothetical protein
LAVLREIADGPLASSDRPVLIETMRTLARELEGATPQLLSTVKSLPVWIGEQWTTRRPVYAIADEGIAAAIASQARVWQPGFAIEGLESLVQTLGLTLIRPEQFLPVTSAGYGAAAGEELRPRFVLAIEHLRSELALRDQQLHGTLAVPWDELAASQLVIDHDLEVAASIPGRRRLLAPTTAHLLRQPLTLFARSADDIGSPEGGGRAIAELFSGDRQKVAWAWAAMWQKAQTGLSAERIVLSSDTTREEAQDDRLTRLQTQADRRRNRKGKTPKNSPSSTAIKRGSVHVRKLKEISQLEPSTGLIVNAGAARGGIIVPRHPPKRAPADAGPRPNLAGSTPSNGTVANASPSQPSPTPSVLPPMSEREQLAYDVVMAALVLGDGGLADLRHRRGVGADAMDELRQSFEIKMASGSDIPDEITLTPSEVGRARTDPDFFLAVVAGLEEGSGDLRVRFIFDPLAQLPLRLRNALSFGGVRDAEALEYVFPSPRPGDGERS